MAKIAKQLTELVGNLLPPNISGSIWEDSM
jgi:hypothetical protein